ncbi:hypothetical protein [Pseudonocardia sp. NPDC049154]|uniref:hypothetical protein n=1 Tax=Pseudonocardia sp. NPDC049154 TaxID=3155501 RepID=UPI0033E27A73
MHLIKRARRKLHRHVDKAMVFLALIDLVADDASLRDQVIDEGGPAVETPRVEEDDRC